MLGSTAAKFISRGELEESLRAEFLSLGDEFLSLGAEFLSLGDEFLSLGLLGVDLFEMTGVYAAKHC